jgi:hypothetical protein
MTMLRICAIGLAAQNVNLFGCVLGLVVGCSTPAVSTCFALVMDKPLRRGFRELTVECGGTILLQTTGKVWARASAGRDKKDIIATVRAAEPDHVGGN